MKNRTVLVATVWTFLVASWGCSRAKDQGGGSCLLNGKPFLCEPALFGWQAGHNVSIGAPLRWVQETCEPPDEELKHVRPYPFVAVSPRGGCSFGTKALVVKALGAAALIVVNSDHFTIRMGCTDAEAQALGPFAVLMVATGVLGPAFESHEVRIDHHVLATTAPAAQSSGATVALAMAEDLWGRGQILDALGQVTRALYSLSLVLFLCFSLAPYHTPIVQMVQVCIFFKWYQSP